MASSAAQVAVDRVSQQDAPSFPGGFEFTNADFNKISAIAKKEFGLHLPSSKMQLVYSRLARRLRALKLTDFKSYLVYLDGADGRDEQLQLLSALTTNVTHFFRESHHFDFLRENCLPSLIERARAGGRVRIWSAGCSSGQEPYSIALTILAMCPEADSLDIRILATDLDPKVLETAKAGQYSLEILEQIPKDMRSTHIEFDIGQPEYGRVGEKAKSLVRIGRLNLIEPLPFSGKMDVIFCRNVAIYFDDETQAKVWATFEQVLTKNGTLFIGHSERISGPVEDVLSSVGTTVYQRKF